MAQFNRERIPKRVVHAKGSGTHGYFVCINPDMPKYTTAKLYSEVGKRTPLFVRFSTIGCRPDRSRARIKCRRILLSTQPLTNEKH